MVDPEPAGRVVSMCFGCFCVVGQEDRDGGTESEGRSYSCKRSVYETWEGESTKADLPRTKSLLMKHGFWVRSPKGDL